MMPVRPPADAHEFIVSLPNRDGFFHVAQCLQEPARPRRRCGVHVWCIQATLHGAHDLGHDQVVRVPDVAREEPRPRRPHEKHGQLHAVIAQRQRPDVNAYLQLHDCVASQNEGWTGAGHGAARGAQNKTGFGQLND